MSHVADVDVAVTDLDALRAACEARGLELADKQTYKWWNRHVGDYPLPHGFSASDLGKCDYAIRVKGAGQTTYEVGVVKRRDGRAGYTFLYDFFGGGHGLVKGLFGEDKAQEFQNWSRASRDGKAPIQPLMAEYEAQVGIKFAKTKVRDGYQWKREKQPNGDPRIRIYRDTPGGTL